MVQALVDGAALHIEGGTFRVAAVCWQCGECGHRWEIEHGSGVGQPAALLSRVLAAPSAATAPHNVPWP